MPSFRNLGIAHEYIFFRWIGELLYMAYADIPESEVFSVEEFREFRIRLINGDGNKMGKVIDFTEWAKKHKEA